MSNPLRNSSLPDPRTDYQIWHDGLHSGPSCELSSTPVEYPFTAIQVCSQLQALQEPLWEIGEEILLEGAIEPEVVLALPSEPDLLLNQGPPLDLENLDLCLLLLALAQQPKLYHQRKYRGIFKPDTFSRGTADNLQAFIFQYQIYFRTCEDKFVEDLEKIYFAIFYLKSIALNYFEPYINKPNPSQSLDFLEDWSAFVQKLSNIFGSYSLEDDNEDAIIAISFPTDKKAVNYFIHFTKYQNQIRWDNLSL